MTSADDWTNAPSPSDSNDRALAPLGGGPGGFGSGGVAIRFSDVLDTTRLLLDKASPQVLTAYLGIALVQALFYGPGWLVALIADESVALGLGALCFSLVSAFASILTSGLIAALMLPIRDTVIEGRPPVTAMDAFRAAWGRFLPTLITTLTFSLTMPLCGLGLIAFIFLGYAPYLASAQGLAAGDALSRSVAVSRIHLNAVVLTFLSMLGVGLVGFGFYAIISSIAPLLAPFGYALAAVMGYASFLLWAALCVTIDAKESGRVILR